MIEAEATVRKWGRSLGIVIPKEQAESLNLKEEDKVRVLIDNRENPLKKIFGKADRLDFGNKSTQELLDEIDREAWDD